MTPYIFDPITHNGHEILVKATTGAGSQQTEAGTVQLTAFRFFLDDVLQFIDSVPTAEIDAAYARGVQALKDQIDALDEAAKKLIALGAEEDSSVDQVATPTGFTATQPGGAGTDVLLSWDVVEPVQLYEVQVSGTSDYADAFTISEADSTPFNVGSFPPGMRYYRIRAKIAGMADSEWATASINVL